MNRKQIIAWAREADWYADTQTDDPYDRRQIRDERFAALVAAAEREACAQILDGVDSYANPMTANDCADAIRARGQA